MSELTVYRNLMSVLIILCWHKNTIEGRFERSRNDFEILSELQSNKTSSDVSYLASIKYTTARENLTSGKYFYTSEVSDLGSGKYSTDAETLGRRVKVVPLDAKVVLHCAPDVPENFIGGEEVCKARKCIYRKRDPVGIGIPSGTLLLKRRLYVWCRFPMNWGYKVGYIDRLEKLEFSNFREAKLVPTSVLGQKYAEALDVHLKVNKEGPYRLQLKFADANNAYRYEIPEEVVQLNPPLEKSGDSEFYVKLTAGENSDDIHSLTVERKGSSGKPLLDTTDLPGFTFEDRFLEFSFRLPTNHLFGLGEQKHNSLKHDFSAGTCFPMFSKAHEYPKRANVWHRPNLSGTHPFIVGIDQDYKAFGVLFWNSNPQEFVLLPNNTVTYRTIGGILDIRMMLGPTPADVFKQYHEMIGKPYFPPYWGLGFHISKSDWGGTSGYGLAESVQSAHSYEIPVDSFQFGVGTMDQQSPFSFSTPSTALKSLLAKIVNDGYHLVATLNPGIPVTKDVLPNVSLFDSGMANNVFVRFPKHLNGGGIVYGKTVARFPNATEEDCYDKFQGTLKPPMSDIWNCSANAAWPDFFKPKTVSWWANHLIAFRKQLKFDGVVLDRNQPENFIDGSINFYNETAHGWNCPLNSKFDNPPYMPGANFLYDDFWVLQTNTLCLSALNQIGGKGIPMYNTHNLYGHGMAKASLHGANVAMETRRSLVISKSTIPGTGKYAGHTSEDYMATWGELRRSLVAALEMNMFGITYTGTNICGSHPQPPDPYNPESYSTQLCFRWYQLGSFYTFSRQHTFKNQADTQPFRYGDKFAFAVGRAMATRYRFLPYLYTLMYHSHKDGGTVMKSLWEVFPHDKNTYSISSQFMWGNALLVSPILYPHTNSVVAYFPGSLWYDVYTGKMLPKNFMSAKVGGRHKLDSPYTGFSGNLPLHMRGGNVFPQQISKSPADVAHDTSFTIYFALDENGTAVGELVFDDGKASLNNVDHPAHKYLQVRYSYLNEEIKVDVVKNALIVGFLPRYRALIILGLVKEGFNVAVVDGPLVATETVEESFIISTDKSIGESFTLKIKQWRAYTTSTTTGIIDTKSAAYSPHITILYTGIIPLFVLFYMYLV